MSYITSYQFFKSYVKKISHKVLTGTNTITPHEIVI